jgi:aspartyl-tRNA(Asn)/glutamyl-tRNA(Gln) amidotransferase subunit A
MISVAPGKGYQIVPDTDLLFMTAARAAALIRSGKLSPVTYMQEVLAAAHAAQPGLNPFVAIMDEPALAGARAAEKAVKDGAKLGPLHGIPVSIKDQVDVDGVVTTHGSAIFADNMPPEDDVTVARLRAAGAVVFAKTRLPEFGHKGLTDGPSFGTTRNPWDPSRTTGGSSGGAGAAVAMGIGPIGLGTDGAGSIRIPAACCGLVGLKPTLGSIPWQQATDAFGNYTYAGPMTRSVTDAALMRAAMVGASDKDPWTLGGGGERGLTPGLIGATCRACASASSPAWPTPACRRKWQSTPSPPSMRWSRWAPMRMLRARGSTGSRCRAG